MTIIIINKYTNEILNVQCNIDSLSSVDEIAFRYFDTIGLDSNNFIYKSIIEDFTINEFIKYKSIVDGEIVDKVNTLDELKDEIIKKLSHNYSVICSGKDPQTGEKIYVDCTYTGGIIRMDGGQIATEKFSSSVSIALRNEVQFIDIVRDFYNVNHINIPIIDAISINRAQWEFSNEIWRDKCMIYENIIASDSEAQLLEANRAIKIYNI